jgi:hypothetical protein
MYRYNPSTALSTNSTWSGRNSSGPADGLLDEQPRGVPQVRAHGGRRGVGVAGGEGGEDRLVLVGDVGQGPGLLRGRRAEGRGDVAQVVDDVDELAVAGGRQHPGVEPLVVAHEQGGVAVDGGGAHRGQLLVQAGQQGVVDPAGGPSHGRDLEQQPQVEHLGDVDVVAVEHPEAAVAGDLDHARLGQPQQALADRGAGDLQLVGQLVDRVQLAGPQLAGADRLPHRVDDLVGEARGSPDPHGGPPLTCRMLHVTLRRGTGGGGPTHGGDQTARPRLRLDELRPHLAAAQAGPEHPVPAGARDPGRVVPVHHPLRPGGDRRRPAALGHQLPARLGDPLGADRPA